MILQTFPCSRKFCVNILFATILSSFVYVGDTFAQRQARHSRYNGRSVRDYDKRSVGSLPGTVTLQTLKNASFMMCSEAMALPYARMVQLDDEHMQAFLQDKGGNYVKDYMAATQEEAIENFPNMLVLTRPMTVDGSTESFSILDNIVAKQTIVDDLNKLIMYLRANTSTNNKNKTEVTNTGTHDGEHHAIETLSKETTTGSVLKTASQNIGSAPAGNAATPMVTHSTHGSTSIPHSSTKSDATVTDMSNTKAHSTLKDSISQSTSQSLLVKTSTLKKFVTGGSLRTVTRDSSTNVISLTPDLATSTSGSIFSTSAQKSETLTVRQDIPSTSPATTLATKSSVTMETKTTLDPEILRGLEQLQHYVQGTVSKRELDFVWREANTTLHPASLLGLATGSERMKRNADGSNSREEYCQNKGALTPDRKFVHLCSICAVTTKLPDDMFPRYINEAVCKTGDTDCFTIAGTSHGQCKQTKFTLNMLHKKTGHCNMLLHGGETLVFENWELVPQVIRVSCECAINKLSVFSQYAAHHVPLG